MIALDYHPFSLVEDKGFTRLLRELEPRYSLPNRRVLQTYYDSLKAKVTQAVSGVNVLALQLIAIIMDNKCEQ